MKLRSGYNYTKDGIYTSVYMDEETWQEYPVYRPTWEITFYDAAEQPHYEHKSFSTRAELTEYVNDIFKYHKHKYHYTDVFYDRFHNSIHTSDYSRMFTRGGFRQYLKKHYSKYEYQ